MPPPLYILFNQCTEEQRFRVRSADFCSIRPDSCTWSYTDPFLVRSVLLATYFLKYFLDRFFYLLGDHSFGVLSRFALYSLYLYCTACSGCLNSARYIIWTGLDGVSFDLSKSDILHFWPTPNPLYYSSDLLARGYTAARWTCGRSARPPSLF